MAAKRVKPKAPAKRKSAKPKRAATRVTKMTTQKLTKLT
jgi:hypothetical protein